METLAFKIENIWEHDIYHEFYYKTDDEKSQMIGKIFFNKYKRIYIPVKCDDETAYTLYGEKYNIFKIWHNLHQPKEKYRVDIKAMIHSIDDGSYSIEWERELMTESFMNTHLFPTIINYIKENCECINGEKFLDFCNNIVNGIKSYD